MHCIARSNTIPDYKYLGEMNYICQQCGAKKFPDETHFWRYCSFSPPPPFFFMIDYDREFHADSEKYKNIALKINGKCSNSTLKF